MQEKEREAFAKRRQRKLVPYAEAVQRRFRIDWKTEPIARAVVPRHARCCAIFR